MFPNGREGSFSYSRMFSGFISVVFLSNRVLAWRVLGGSVEWPRSHSVLQILSAPDVQTVQPENPTWQHFGNRVTKGLKSSQNMSETFPVVLLLDVVFFLLWEKIFCQKKKSNVFQKPELCQRVYSTLQLWRLVLVSAFSMFIRKMGKNVIIKMSAVFCVLSAPHQTVFRNRFTQSTMLFCIHTWGYFSAVWLCWAVQMNWTITQRGWVRLQ